MSSPSSNNQPAWQDRRGIFQPGRQVHEPATKPIRKASVSSTGSSGGGSSGDKVESPTTAGGIMPSFGTVGQRRRSSASSSGNGLFGGLMTANRTGQSSDATQRRQSWDEMRKDGGLPSGGFLSNILGGGKK